MILRQVVIKRLISTDSNIIAEAKSVAKYLVITARRFSH